MLDNIEQSVINEQLYSTDQDYFFWSRILGEPFLYDGLLYYYDGKSLSIVGFPLDKKIPERQVSKRIAEGVEFWQDQIEIQYISYVGPYLLKLNSNTLKKYRLFYSEEPRKYNVDVFLDLKHPKLLKTKNAKDSILKIRKQEFNIKVVKRDILSYQHVNLLRKLICNRNICFDDLSYIISSLVCSNNKFTTFFELERNDTLVGYIVAHEYFAQKPILLAACFEDSVYGVSDALYSTTIKYYIMKDASFLGLGYSGDQGLYNYKTKWGGSFCNQPVYQFAWKKKGIREKAEKYCLYWPTNLLINEM